MTRELVLNPGETAKLMKTGVTVALEFGASGARLDPDHANTPGHLETLRQWRDQTFTDGAAI